MAMKKFRSVDHYFEELELWAHESAKLREILLTTELEETLKWSIPCYTYQGKNVVGLGSFKSYFGIWFYQGSLMDDPDGVLINAQEGKTQAMLQWRMSAQKDIKARQVKKYIRLAMAVVESGAEIKPRRGKPIVVHPLLRSALENNKVAAAAFKAMRPGGQREYADYINDAKKDETKIRRISKILPMIATGGGLNDKYRS